MKLFFLTALTLLLTGAAQAVSYEKEVRPILKAHCFHCHGEHGHTEAKLDLRLHHLILQGGSGGPVITPGDRHQSELFTMVASDEMPEGNVQKLSPQEKETLARWIDAGAPLDTPEPTTTDPDLYLSPHDRSHWSFQSITFPTPPKIGNTPNPIDAFLLKKLHANQLDYSPKTDPRTLLRRLTYALTGLPPTFDEVRDFSDFDSPDALEKTVDRLLASPHYGEHWGRHWLDIAGYADSEGYNESDSLRPHAYRYRDYVIQSHNYDLPFDQFITEQLAGDELLPPDPDLHHPETQRLLAATGFLRMAPDGTGSRNDDPALARHHVLTDTVKIVSSSLLGLTVACAECHNHRFDPILQKDFYQLRALFEPALDPTDWKNPSQRRISLYTKSDAAKAAAKDRTPEQTKILRDTYPNIRVGRGAELDLYLGLFKQGQKLKDELDALKKQASEIRAKKPPEPFLRALREPSKKPPPKTVIFNRGDYTSPGPAVPPGSLAVLDHLPLPVIAQNNPKLPTTGRRLAFAKNLTDPRHPLTARVIVNRVWLHHFGRGLVNTPADFGLQGDRPSHPELLDWLASDFIRHGWSLKHLHRRILTSRAFQQTSTRHQDGQEIDAENTLLWRMPVRRLPAEAVRDSILATTGQLDRTLHGKAIPVSADKNNLFVISEKSPRRSIYAQVLRDKPTTLLEVFDAPRVEPNCEQRQSSTVTTQALSLLNSDFALAQSQHFATRILSKENLTPEQQITQAWQLALQKTPTPSLLADATSYLKTQTTHFTKNPPKEKNTSPQELALTTLCQSLLASNPFLYLE